MRRRHGGTYCYSVGMGNHPLYRVKNVSTVGKDEFSVSLLIFFISSAALVVTLAYAIVYTVETESGEPFLALLLCLPNPLLMWIIYIKKAA